MPMLSGLFTDEVLASLLNVQRPPASPWDDGGIPVRRRHEVVRCTGPEPWRSGWALKRAWEGYLSAANECGLLADAELRANLTGGDDESFRGAMAECLVTWFVLRKLGMAVTPKPEPKAQKNVDFAARSGSLEVFGEVKSPYVPLLNCVGSGDDSRNLRACVEAAGPQFKKGRCNVLFLAPVLRTPIYMNRDQLVKAVVGEQALAVYVSFDPHRPAPPPEPTFLQTGKLARLHPQKDGSIRTDYTRISAVVSVEEILFEAATGERTVDHKTTVVHNPFAEVALPPEAFGAYPQLVKRADGNMEWTDRLDATR